jgi:molecular chaperone GrpE
MPDEEKNAAPAGKASAGAEAAPPSDSAGDTMEKRVERLTQELEEKTKEAADNHDRYLRERADLENFKKRMQREKAEALKFANEDLIRDFLPVLDNLERAIEHVESGGNGQPLAEGVKLVFKNALDVLRRYGVRRVEAVGQPFDPAHHEAVLRVPVRAGEVNQVVAQFLPGYCLHERLLRPAQVSVSTKEPVEKADSDD